MKKTFVKVSFLSMMLSLMPVAMTSCKDYDDDITEINGTTDQLSSQIAAINSAIEANKAAAQAAQNAADASLKAAQAAQSTGDQAEADAQKAMTVAKAAEAAAAQAKADALDQIKLEAEALAKQIAANNGAIGDNAQAIKENSEAISALLGRMNGVEKGLADLDIDGINAKIVELNTALEAVNTQLKALEGYETRLNQLESQYSGIAAEVSEAKANIAAVKTDLAELQTKVNKIVADVAANAANITANASAITALRNDLATLSQEVSTKVQNGINTIAGVISARLTSVTLMPDLYVGGIPTIEFKSAQYNSLVWQNGKWVESSNTYRVSNNKTEIEYRLNPTTIQLSDINKNGLAFVSRIATTRAAEVDNDIISAIDATISSNGVLKVIAGKSNTNSLNLSGNKIYTVSLKVPIAKQHLFENEGSACVYSEYTRLSEVYFQPNLHKTSEVRSSIPAHFNDSTEVYNSKVNELVAKEVQYDNTLNLNELVEGCGFVAPDSHEILSLDQLKEYGFEVSYSLATKAYTTGSEDHTNQQSFAKIEGSTFIPGVPTNTGFVTENQAAIGKQPIVHVWLKDTKNNKLVDQRYFKILIQRETIKPLSFAITPAKELNMGCNDYTWNVTWDEMTKQVLSQFPNKGLSKEEFYQRYGAHASNIEVKVDGVANSNLVANVTDNVTLDNTGASVPVMTFTLDNAELGALAQGKSKTYSITLTYTDKKDLTPSVSITFTCVVNNKIATPTLGKTDALKWKNETMLLYPIPYGSANAQKNAEYNTNILEGRYNPLINGMLGCATWNLAFAQNYSGVSMTFPATYGGWMDQAYANTLKQVDVAIAHNAQGIALVEAATALKLNWKARLNGIAGNEVNFANSTLQIVKPLQNPQVDNSVVLQDKPFAQTVNLADKFTLKDAYNETVANTSGMPKNLWDYYGVTEVIFGNAAGDIMVTDNTNGANPRSLKSLNMTADINVATQVLTFHANGSPLQGDGYLQIPVQVKHYWGTLKANLYIKIQHTL
ncbi:MAG: hypothetical protein K2M56_02300 [Muribaculaceae bacterium]|nr:hypothetical protein [Muribaculaceae bacterium]